METFGEYIRRLREEQKMPLRKLAADLDIDQSTLSKIERNERTFAKKMIPKLSKVFNLDCDSLTIRFLSDKVANELKDEDLVIKILRAAERQVEYFQNKRKVDE